MPSLEVSQEAKNILTNLTPVDAPVFNTTDERFNSSLHQSAEKTGLVQAQVDQVQDSVVNFVDGIEDTSREFEKSFDDVDANSEGDDFVETVSMEPASSETPVTEPAPEGGYSTIEEVTQNYKQDMDTFYPPSEGRENSVLNTALSSGEGNMQPGSVNLTSQQGKILAEAIAHNINLQQEAMAQAQYAADVAAYNEYVDYVNAMMSQGYGTMLDNGATGFIPNLSASSDYHQRVLDLCSQLASAGIPYAWGGGTLTGPSQGISDGGGYADACGDYAKIGFDCSGLSRYVTYQTTGEEIPRVSEAQVGYCVPVSSPMIGDLGFPAGGSPGHVVVFVDGGMQFEAQQSGTFLMYNPANPSYVWGRPPASPNWALAQGVSAF